MKLIALSEGIIPLLNANRDKCYPYITYVICTPVVESLTTV